MSIWLDLRELGRSFQYIVHLQHSDQSPPRLSNLLDSHAGWSAHGQVAFSARIRPQEADLRLIARWLKKCQAEHKHSCDVSVEKTLGKLRFIDLQGLCIVESVQDPVWVTLSYCWGGAQPHCLTRANFNALRAPAGLSRHDLPQVIRDAMLITAALDLRFLWIDSMCIIQDSESDKATYLPLMAAIYGQSALTIVNAATASVADREGLPGIGSPGRRLPHDLFEINATWLTEALDPGYSTYGGGGFVIDSKWTTRGWTFQEGYLTRRALIITQDQIYWQCRQSTWCEGSFWEQDDDKQIFRSYFGDNVLGALFEKSRSLAWTEIYQSILRDYQIRRFGDEADRLHALTGVLNALRIYAEHHFLWAMPQGKLEQAMVFVSPGTRRRIASHATIDSRGRLSSCPFPTWSWLGWSGQIDMRAVHPSIVIGRLGLVFFRIRIDGRPVRIEQVEDEQEQYEQGDVRNITQYPRHANHKWMHKDQQQIGSADIPVAVLAEKSLIPSLLCFWTSAAVLQIEPLGPNNYYHEFAARLSAGNVNFFSLWPGSGNNFQYPGQGTFIVVGAEKERMSRGGRLTLKLLLVESDDKLPEVYRRKALITTVGEEDWVKLENREWRLTFLA